MAIPGVCTSKVQPLDVSLNKPFKSYVHHYWSDYIMISPPAFRPRSWNLLKRRMLPVGLHLCRSYITNSHNWRVTNSGALMSWSRMWVWEMLHQSDSSHTKFLLLCDTKWKGSLTRWCSCIGRKECHNRASRPDSEYIITEQYPNCFNYMVTIPYIPYIVSGVRSILIWCHMAVCSL